jgi:acetyltransferase-like isoleucine patch superfamily enzyme
MTLSFKQRVGQFWSDFWMRRSGLGRTGRFATKMAALLASPYKGRVALAQRYQQGFVDPSAAVAAQDVRLGQHAFLGERVVIYRRPEGHVVEIGDRAEVHRDTIIEVGRGGRVVIGAETGIQPRCQLSAYVGSILIGKFVQIAPGCAFYPYDHQMEPGILMRDQPISSKGDIVIDDDAWLGTGVIVLSGVRIGAGAVIGAGSVVTKSIPAGAIAVGNPAKVVKMRGEA